MRSKPPSPIFTVTPMYAQRVIHERLPYEVLSHAFSFLDPSLHLDEATFSSAQDASLKGVAVFEVATALSLVCKAWRYLALDVPRLWTSAHIRIKKKLITQDTIDAAREWYARSKKSGCHLFLEFPLHMAKSSGSQMVENLVVNLVQTIAPRLETLVLCIPAVSLSCLEKVSLSQLSRLQTFSIRFPRDDCSAMGSLHLPPDAFSKCYSLRNLELMHPAALGMLRAARFQIPYFNPTFFHYAGFESLKIIDYRMQVDVAIDILHLSTNLHSCELTLSGRFTLSHTTSPVPQGSRTHPNLRVLKLHFTRGYLSRFFVILNTDLPRLEDLWVSFPPDVDPGNSTLFFQHLLDFTQRHCPVSLRRLEIRGVTKLCSEPFGVAQLLRFLQRNDDIEVLALEGLEASRDTFLKELVWRNVAISLPQTHPPRFGGQLLPKLTSFSLEDLGFRDVKDRLTDEVVLKFLSSRWDGLEQSEDEEKPEGPARLRKVLLPQSWGMIPMPRTGQELERLRRAGLVIPVPHFLREPPENPDDWAT